MKQFQFFIILMLVSCTEFAVEPIISTSAQFNNDSFCFEGLIEPQKSAYEVKNSNSRSESTDCEIYSFDIKIWNTKLPQFSNHQNTLSDIMTAVNILENDFSNANITFNLLGVNNITISNLTSEQLQQPDLVLGGLNGLNTFQYQSSNRIDIFITPNIPGWEGGGLKGGSGHTLAYGGTRDNQNLVPTAVLSHEVGHILGLLHTYQGSDKSATTITDPSNLDCLGGKHCHELVNGNQANRENCGDCVTDTPASPGDGNPFAQYLDPQTCEFIPGARDRNNDLYTGVLSNIMTSSYGQCALSFSPFTNGQIERMRRMINTFTVLDNMVSTTNDPNCCKLSNWSLTNLPGSAVTVGQTINYKIREVGSAVKIKSNQPTIRVEATAFPINVTYQGHSYPISIQDGSGFVDIPISGSGECAINPIINTPLKFYRINAPMWPGFNDLKVSVRLHSLSAGHIISSDGLHEFDLVN